MLGDTGNSQRLALNWFGAACERGKAPPLPGGDLRTRAVYAARRALSRDQRQRGPPSAVRQEVYAELLVSQKVHAPAAYKALFQSYLRERFLELLADGGATTAKGRGAARKAARRMTLCGELARRVTQRVFAAGAGGFTLPPLPPAAGGVYDDAYYTGADAAIRKYAREVVAAAITAEGAAAAAAAAPKQHLVRPPEIQSASK